MFTITRLGTLVVAAVLASGAAVNAGTTYKVLHSFTGKSDGSGPSGGVSLDPSGNLYGATNSGGDMSQCEGYGCGVVFELSPGAKGEWNEKVLFDFDSNDDGGYASDGNVFIGSGGHLYGTTYYGGAYHSGTVFELTQGANGWTEDTLYSFGSYPRDGGEPTAGVVMDGAGNLYGTARTIAFELTPDKDGWKENVLHRFGVKKGDGALVDAGLILDGAGSLYGATFAGGNGCAGEGCGTVFEIEPRPSGWKETLLHRFDNNGKDGVNPSYGSLAMDGAGNLYGTTEVGGDGCDSKGCWGTVYELTPRAGGQWEESIIHDFRQGPNGSLPGSGVVVDKAGNLYGTTVDGGTTCDCGVVYKLSPQPGGKWIYGVLHRFSGYDGAVPAGNLVLDDKGNLYGGTVLGGGYDQGVVFEITP